MEPLTTLVPAFFFLALAEPVAPADVDQAAATVMIAQDEAWNRHDADALAALFSEDGTLVTPSGRRVVGHAALRALFAEEGPTKRTASKTTVVGVQRLGPDLLLVDAAQELSGPGTAVVGTRARGVAVLRRHEGAWRVVAMRPFALPAPKGR